MHRYILFLLLATALAKPTKNDYEVVGVSNHIEEGVLTSSYSLLYNGQQSYYGKPISTIAQSLDVTFLHESQDEFTVTITDPNQAPRFSLPHDFPFSYTKTQLESNQTTDYEINTTTNPFSFSVVRSSTNETIFNTTSFDFVYSEYFLTFGTRLPSKYLYGLGERATDFLYESGTYTIWNRDQPAQMDNGTGAQQLYGSHPVYLMREKSGKWHMVYLRTTNALEFVFNSTTKTLQFMLTGGIIELKFFLGDENPDTAIRKYHNYINGWMIQPFWAHGFHQCRWGYENLTALENVVNNMTAHKLPIDVIWSDIDYMSNFTDFTVDTTRYNLTRLRKLLEKVHFVPIVDAGVAINQSALAYNLGEELNVWIRSALQNGHPLTGVVWPGLVHWPDWFNPNSSIYWEEMLSVLYDLVPFSGIWLDMNENSNFCNGEYPFNCQFQINYLPNAGVNPNTSTYSNGDDSVDPYPWGPINASIKSFNSSSLPYVPGGVPLETHAISLNGLHHGDLLEFDTHNLNGFYEAMYTNVGIQQATGSRPFILSRSTFVGSGQFTAHWTGDNVASWDFLRVSIPTIFNFQLYGIPMVGADICGFIGNTTAELCARWMQLGAFYPFMRNHNVYGAISQEPYALGPDVLAASRASLRLRYSILKFYYSVFIRNKGLGSVFRPIFFDFNDDETLLSLETQFLIGSELMVASVGYENVTQVGIYFPAGPYWFDFFTGDIMLEQGTFAMNITVDVPLNGTLPVFVKGGSIVHTQDVTNVSNTAQLTNIFNLVVGLESLDYHLSQASGQMLGISNYTDDASVDQCLGENDCLINLNVSANAATDGGSTILINISPNASNTVLEEVYISSVKFYGVKKIECDPSGEACVYYNKKVKCNLEEPVRVKFGAMKFAINPKLKCKLKSYKSN